MCKMESGSKPPDLAGSELGSQLPAGPVLCNALLETRFYHLHPEKTSAAPSNFPSLHCFSTARSRPPTCREQDKAGLVWRWSQSLGWGKEGMKGREEGKEEKVPFGGGGSNASQVQSSSHPLCNLGGADNKSTCYAHQRSLRPAAWAGNGLFAALHHSSPPCNHMPLPNHS